MPWNRHRTLAWGARAAAAAAVLLVARAPASAQQSPSGTDNASTGSADTRAPPSAQAPAPGSTDSASTPATPWAVGVYLTGNFFPKDRQSDFLQPTVTVDHGWLHLEARYQYEALRTGSVWVGWNFFWGDSLTFALTPVFGVVFGLARGVAPGIEWDLRWGPLEATSTNEFVFDFANWGESDFNYWAEGRVWPWPWLKLGVALTRTRAIETRSPEQWGPLVGVQVWKIGAAVYWMNPGNSSDQYWSALLSLNL